MVFDLRLKDNFKLFIAGPSGKKKERKRQQQHMNIIHNQIFCQDAERQHLSWIL